MKVKKDNEPREMGENEVMAKTVQLTTLQEILPWHKAGNAGQRSKQILHERRCVNWNVKKILCISH